MLSVIHDSLFVKLQLVLYVLRPLIDIVLPLKDTWNEDLLIVNDGASCTTVIGILKFSDGTEILNVPSLELDVELF